jgi:2-polyprenyl-6-methoxyphenol hydroxylase-like FAD-dependent oxidoreductase
MRVAVVGAGIGGLTAALSLRAAGLDVEVYKQASTISEVGAGIQVSPNASRILHGLGLADELAQTAVEPLAWHQRRWDDGRTLLRTPLAAAMLDAFGAPHYQTHRADLLAVLLAAMEPYRDGIHSTVREALFGPLRPRFTGCVAYRGLVPSERLDELDLEVTSQVWMGPGGHFVHYFVQGGRLVNFVAVVEQDSWTRESWTDRGDVADALAAYDGWHPHVRAILAAVDESSSGHSSTGSRSSAGRAAA